MRSARRLLRAEVEENMKRISAWAFVVASVWAGVGGCAAGAPEPGQEEAAQRGAAISQPAGVRHGIWVYSVYSAAGGALLDTDPNGSQLAAFLGAHDINEVYLSVANNAFGSLPDRARVRAFVAGLRGVPGVRVEALIGQPTVGEYPIKKDHMLARINQIAAYNVEASSAAERFDGIHLDLEPWVGRMQQPALYAEIVGDLVSAFDLAAAEITARPESYNQGMSLAADIGGLFYDRQPSDARQSLLLAAGRLVLMEYEITEAKVVERMDRALDDATADHPVMVSTRLQDFALCTNGAVLGRFDTQWAATAGYGGWATFHYGHYDRGEPRVWTSYCPTEGCCDIP
ncbi:hypothetical protein [Sorangium sp. So ce131]|uniref:hypothetical protein n=1 Tax=Sorangium sp. So ce131 TaxID=3133282 RepID=UPI003F647C62